MVGRARPFGRLAGLVDAAERDDRRPAGGGARRPAKPASARRVSSASCSTRCRPGVTTIGIIGPAGLDGSTAATPSPPLAAPRRWPDDRPGRPPPCSTSWPPPCAAGPTVLVVEDLHWIDTASANLDRPHRPAAVAEPRDHRHLPSRRPLAGAARRRARAAPRAPPLGRAGPPRPARPVRGRCDGRGDRRPERAVVGVRRGAAPPQRRRAVRRRGADARRRARGRWSPTCSRPSCRGRWRRRCASSSRGSTHGRAQRRRGARRVRPGGVVRRPARR